MQAAATVEAVEREEIVVLTDAMRIEGIQRTEVFTASAADVH
jgi:hypothetical protein